MVVGAPERGASVWARNGSLRSSRPLKPSHADATARSAALKEGTPAPAAACRHYGDEWW